MELKKALIIYAVIAFLSLLPLLSALLAALIANLNHAQLDEGSVHPCIVMGVDIGHILYSMALVAWFGMITLPAGFLVAIGFSIYLIMQ